MFFHLQKKSYQDIAEETKYSIGEVKSHIQNGKRNLKIIMEKDSIRRWSKKATG
jgi:RNA polymerase sigma-70 factor (ECF subfamily)